jgi:hypothetical protein
LRASCRRARWLRRPAATSAGRTGVSRIAAWWSGWPDHCLAGPPEQPPASAGGFLAFLARAFLARAFLARAFLAAAGRDLYPVPGHGRAAGYVRGPASTSRSVIF